MYGLTSDLSMASHALNAESGAISITSNNIANVNTAGYTRELVNFSSQSTQGGDGTQGDGVSLGNFTSVRDEILQLAINQKTSDSSSLNTQSAAWSQIESAFSDPSTGVGASFSGFFSALSSLSTAPTNVAAQQSVLTAANQVASAFNQTAQTLYTVQSSADQSVAATVAQVNQLSSQIAALDGQVSTLQASGQDGGALEDQRDQLTQQLSQLLGITSTNTSTTPSLGTADGTPLVVGSSAFALQVTQGSDGQAQVLNANGENITSSITGGSLGGAFTMRDQTVPQLLGSLDQLAYQFATAVNQAQEAGYDQNGNAGQALFTVPPSAPGSADSISVNLTDPSLIAINSGASSGSAGNIANLLAVQSNALPSGQTPTNAFAEFTEQVGQGSQAVTSNLTASTAALSQLTTQQASESGVSVDEETTNLMRFQQAYSAAAQVITTVNNLFSTVLNMDSVTS